MDPVRRRSSKRKALRLAQLLAELEVAATERRPAPRRRRALLGVSRQAA
jgi:hypothetical protein